MLRAGSARDELRTGDALYRLEVHSSGIERDSVASDGTEGNGHSYDPSISADGRFVAFVSKASNLVISDTKGYRDVFVTSNPLLGITKHYYANGQRVAMRQGDVVYYVHQDHLGSTVAVSDQDGQAVGRMQYDPYGEIISSTLPVALTDRLFTGQRFDSSTGLYYYNARYYDPYLGRFIQPDTLVPDPLNPQAWNRFTYCYNNPASYVDPGGHVAWVPILIFGGAFLVGAGAGGYYAYQQGYSFESWQLYAYAGMGGLAGVAGAATGMWIEAALLPVGAAVWQAAAAGAAGGFAAGVVEQSVLEIGGAAILGTEVSGERILLAGATGGVTGGTTALVRRAIGNYITRRLTQLTESAAQNPALTLRERRAIQRGVRPARALWSRGVHVRLERLAEKDWILPHILEMTPHIPPGQFGPDYYVPWLGRWWDLTTEGQWAAHVAKYAAQFGRGTRIPYP
jgi:RHS repeat-associated protein